ncbi:hypothetical protein PCANC_12224 [Puccinia coronata f. sp. avenae]|uniref:Uncharacterized protein n=1 Tax=Puccinia coronata f. sp. avenae TaxID=200324 RepID=A0A2N5UAC4_9BASI|nr:hypothetical protein PCANC_12224 [Puccinia coronata f. sp. avenae]
MGVFARRRGRATPDHPENTSPPPDLTSLRASHGLRSTYIHIRTGAVSAELAHIPTSFKFCLKNHPLPSPSPLRIHPILQTGHLHVVQAAYQHLDQTITTNPKCPFELSDSFRVVGRICKIYRRIN